MDTEEAVQKLVDISILGRLIPWKLIDGYDDIRSIADLKEIAGKADFGKFLESNREALASAF